MSSQHEFTYGSTFAGCGGSSLGYKWAGGRGVFAVEFDDNAVETYRLNFPETQVLHRDIATVTAEELLELASLQIGELDILDGSPPCQGFSTAGKRVLTDPRNALFKEYVRLIEGLQPKVFVMENVSGLVKGKMKLAFREIMLALKATGYAVRCKLLNAMYYEVPQSRERLIWIGVRPDIGIEPSFPKAHGKPKPLRDIAPDVIACRSQAINPWIPSTRACCTLTKTPFKGLFKTALGTREPTQEELLTIGSFPLEFRFLNKADAWERIGNSVPPRFMFHIAAHIRDTVLRPHSEATGAPFPAGE